MVLPQFPTLDYYFLLLLIIVTIIITTIIITVSRKRQLDLALLLNASRDKSIQNAESISLFLYSTVHEQDSHPLLVEAFDLFFLLGSFVVSAKLSVKTVSEYLKLGIFQLFKGIQQNSDFSSLKEIIAGT